jgi:type IX secretion system PorP/SprF family membrane protein
MKRLQILSILLLYLSLGDGFAQTPGPFYRQFFFNPYLSNPAFVAINNNLEANVVYRQQWTDFKDAPVTMGANIQFPASDRVALGFNVFTDKQVLLRNSNFMATFGYIVPIDAKQSLRFALSGGVGLNKLDLTAEELNTNDPAIRSATGNNFYVDGNFGVVYTNSGLRLGFALTDIFKSNTFNSESFNTFEFSNLRNRLFSASYKFNLNPMGTVSLEPYFLYRQTEDGLQDSWEAASLVYFKDTFWTGLSYNQYNGLAIFIGLNLKEKFRFSYSYEFPPTRSGFTSGSSHELHLGIKFRTQKSNSYVKKSSVSATKLTYNEIDETPDTENELSADAEIEKTAETDVIPVRNENPEGDLAIIAKAPVEKNNKDHSNEGLKKTASAITSKTSKPLESFTMTAGHHYVVVGVYKVLSHSMKFSKEMISNGHPVNVALNPKDSQYYVYLTSSTDPEEAKRMRNEFKRKNLLKEAWVYTP